MSRAVSKHMMQRKSGQLLQLVQMQQIRREWRYCICCIKSCNDDVYEVFRIRTCSVQHSL